MAKEFTGPAFSSPRLLSVALGNLPAYNTSYAEFFFTRAFQAITNLQPMATLPKLDSHISKPLTSDSRHTVVKLQIIKKLLLCCNVEPFN